MMPMPRLSNSSCSTHCLPALFTVNWDHHQRCSRHQSMHVKIRSGASSSSEWIQKRQVGGKRHVPIPPEGLLAAEDHCPDGKDTIRSAGTRHLALRPGISMGIPCRFGLPFLPVGLSGSRENLFTSQDPTLGPASPPRTALAWPQKPWGPTQNRVLPTANPPEERGWIDG